MPRKATIGPAVYERVNELVKEGKTRTEAFAQVGQERGAQPGTVAANYDRTARSHGETGRTRRRRRTSATGTTRTRTPARATTRARTASPSAGSRAGSNGGDLGALAAQIATLTQQLVKQIEERDARLREALR